MFYGRMNRRRFAVWAGISVGFMLATTLLYPLYMLAMQGNCGSVHGACGAVALISTMIYKPLVFVIFVFLLIGPCLRRSRDAGLPAWFGLIVPALVIADHEFLVFGGAFWAFGFSSGVLGLSFPWFAILALVCMGVLASLPTIEGARPSLRRFGAAGALVAIAGIGLLWTMLPAYLRLLPPGTMTSLRGLFMLFHGSAMARPYLIGLFGASIVLLAWLYRHPPTATPEAERLPDNPELRLPLIRLAIVAIVIAALVILVGFPERDLGPQLLLIGFVPIVLPTALIYFVPLLAGAFLLRGRVVAAVAVGIAATLPFIHWGYEHFEAAGARAEAARRVAALPQTPIESYPTVLVVEGSGDMPPGAWSVPGLARVITGEAPYLQATNFEDGRRLHRRVKVVGLPTDYLLIRVRQAAALHEKGAMYMYDTPYELAVVRAGTEYPVASTFKLRGNGPSVLPILTDHGWQRESAVQRSEDIDAFGRAFFAEALAGARPEAKPVS